MNATQMRDIQMLRRQAVWFREFARLGAREECRELAELSERQAQQAWNKLVGNMQ